MIRPTRDLTGDKLTRNAAFRMSVFRLFWAFDFVALTVEKPDAHKYVVVKSNWIDGTL